MFIKTLNKQLHLTQKHVLPRTVKNCPVAKFDQLLSPEILTNKSLFMELYSFLVDLCYSDLVVLFDKSFVVKELLHNNKNGLVDLCFNLVEFDVNNIELIIVVLELSARLVCMLDVLPNRKLVELIQLLLKCTDTEENTSRFVTLVTVKNCQLFEMYQYDTINKTLDLKNPNTKNLLLQIIITSNELCCLTKYHLKLLKQLTNSKNNSVDLDINNNDMLAFVNQHKEPQKKEVLFWGFVQYLIVDTGLNHTKEQAFKLENIIKEHCLCVLKNPLLAKIKQIQKYKRHM